MIKKIEVNFPDYKLERELTFKKGINVVEKPNKWGKSTILNTIMSAYTGYFGSVKTLPNGFASIETDNGKLNLVKKQWIGNRTVEPLARYAIVGSFFNDTKSTVEQRKILTEFLEIDMDEYVNNYIDNFMKGLDDNQKEYYQDVTTSIETLRVSLKDSKNKEGIVIEDITRYKSEILGFKLQEFKDIEEFNKRKEEILIDYNNYKDTVNKSIQENQNIIRENNSITNNISSLKTKIESKETELNKLRKEYEDNTSGQCFNCGQAMSVPEEKLESLKTKGIELGEIIKELKEELSELEGKKLRQIKEVNMLGLEDYISKEGISISKVSEERLQEYEQYIEKLKHIEFIKKELKIKEDRLKEINTIQLEDCIKIHDEAVEEFNKELEKKIKTTGLNIELFKTLKNGNIKQTFNIYSEDGTEYNNCSTGEKMVIQIKLALLFINKFGFDFVLVDEGGIIGKDNFIILKQMLKDYQVILFKADKWTLTSK